MADSLVKSLPNSTVLTTSPSMLDLLFFELYQSGGDVSNPANNIYVSENIFLRDFLNAIWAAKGSSLRNKIINGDMRTDQRNAGASLTPATDGQYTVDRWQARMSQASKFSVQQKSGTLFQAIGGSSYYVQLKSLSAYSVGVSDFFAFTQPIEGLNVQDLDYGSAGAKAISVSFLINSDTLTGTFTGSIRNYLAGYSFPFTFNIAAINTPQKIVVTIPGDTANALDLTNSASLGLNISLGAGTNETGAAGSWIHATLFGANGGVSLVGTNAASLMLTDVQFEPAPFGATVANPAATPFERKPYSQAFVDCKRYYQEIFPGVDSCPIMMGQAANSSTTFGGLSFSKMRATPTVGLPNGGTDGNAAGKAYWANQSVNPPTTIGVTAVSRISATHMLIDGTGYSAAFNAGDCSMYLTGDGTTKLTLNAEI